MRAGLLHTVPALAEVFQRRLAELAPKLELVHVADPSLLARAIATGVDEDVRERVRAHVRHLAAVGSQAVMVTCSSIGEAAEDAVRAVEVPVLRVDDAMAERAVDLAARAGGPVAVLATLDSTLGPTERLLRRHAESRPGVVIASQLVAGAAAARGSGDDSEHDRLVRAAVDDAAGRAAVVVLAQASMAGAVDQSGAVEVPVLGSVDTGAERLAATVTGELPGKC